jgi:hypothetical protein
MIPSRIGCELAVLTVLCVLMIFFFPVMQGPYSVVHGPATALLAARAAARLRVVIMQGALNSLGNFLILPLVISWMFLSAAEFSSVSLPEYTPYSVADFPRIVVLEPIDLSSRLRRPDQ